MRYLIVVVLLALPLRAAEEAAANAKKERVDRVAAEVQRRAELRKEAAAAEENARRIVREHESGARKASEEELAAARALIRQADELRAKGKPNATGGIQLSVPDGDMKTTATVCRQLFGREVAVSDRAKSKSITIKFSAASLDEARVKLETTLRENGIFVIHRSEGILLDTEPADKQSK